MNEQEQIDELKREILRVKHVLMTLTRSISIAVQDISYTDPTCRRCGNLLSAGITCNALNSECPSGIGRKAEAQG